MRKCAVAGKAHVFAEQGITWLSKISEFQISIVSSSKRELGTAITNFYSLQRLVCFHISHLNEESVYTVIFPLRYKSGIEDTMSGGLSKTAGPEFGRSDIRSMEHELLRMLIICCCCL